MRIITGKFKKANLFSVPGKETRPTTDSLKEIIFSLLFSCEDQDVLDLFAGSGSLGLEALSRGARKVVFVDQSEKSVKTIYQNIQKLNCSLETEVKKKRVSAFLKNCDEKFDLIFLDPPYENNLINPTLDMIIDGNLLNHGGRIVIEHSLRENLNENWRDKLVKERNNGSSRVSILEPV
ncbi:MAG: 16S rRNA (guanine(966)-N(2))-methyltransferase RsmD [Candidatus Cloacimonetes bacterium]|nr:16S rRNA (guanine(966)-N(2))-methyltransferase RsmD [Candidatus Cloacimonadota bacterium]